MKEGKKLALELSLDELNLIWSILHDLHSDPEVELKEEDVCEAYGVSRLDPDRVAVAVPPLRRRRE